MNIYDLNVYKVVKQIKTFKMLIMATFQHQRSYLAVTV